MSSGREGGPILLELSAAQVDEVIGAAGESNGIRGALSGARTLTALGARAALLEHPGLSRSLLAGLIVLAAFPTDRSYLGNSQVAEIVGMSLATTHRYISTLLAAGLLERDPQTRKYRRA
ncbi:MAG TPA: helix-turn-helix domain-containing protein [Solirubrobacteraceae bacterium]|nr:helix-turn-helix domain-containing protein [Solirubrobacteraceae bacterium]